ncbi:MAG: hypothetical protein FWE97_01665 [Dehalococcoidia bacterium]|nr:hypothetical protein [Dehalococcoidia bacterium]
MSVFQHGGSDIGLYYKYASWMGEGFIPYRDFSVEYPPIALLIFYLPYLATHDFSGYCTAFAVEMMLFGMAGIFLVLGMARRLRVSSGVALLCYTLAVFAIGSITVQRFDLAPAVITLAALYAFCRGKFEVAWVVLAIGLMTKLYPAVLAPLFLIYQWQRDGVRRLLPSLAAFLLTLVLIAGPALWLGKGEFIHSFAVQSGRSLQLESLYASLLLLLNSLGLVSAAPVQGPMSFDVSSPLAEPLAQSAFIIMGLALFSVYVLFLRRTRRDLGLSGQSALSAETTSRIINFSMAAVAVFIIANKVFSPQFILWLCPLIPLFSGRWYKVGWAIFILAACLTWYVYPMYYLGLADGQQVVMNALILRNVLVLLLILLLVLNPSRSAVSSAGMPALATADD